MVYHTLCNNNISQENMKIGVHNLNMLKNMFSSSKSLILKLRTNKLLFTKSQIITRESVDLQVLFKFQIQ